MDISTFHFANPKNLIVMLNIYDITGRKVRQYETSNDKIIIHNKNMPNGLYYYRFFSITNEELISNGKIIFVKTN